MASEKKCEWCGGYGTDWYHNRSDGKYGFFCSRKCIIEAAKENFGGTKRNCFITTAVCERLDLPDDCEELTTLRNFRDRYLAKRDSMLDDIREYYKIAPLITNEIDKRENAGSIYSEIYQDHIKTAVSAINSNKLEKAYFIYKNMVEQLKNRFLIE
ncbi:MAG: hypothetical protein HN368_19510 [Spirochaetales bacterium]|jgi:hypothetical protein|nr:hypothetical protein [Spirochaetales bacterium]